MEISFVLGLIIGGGMMYFYQRLIAVDEDKFLSVNATRSKVKEERKNKIIEMIRQAGSIRNDDVEKEFDVSHATATRYFDELEAEGKIIASESPRRSITYTLK